MDNCLVVWPQSRSHPGVSKTGSSFYHFSSLVSQQKSHLPARNYRADTFHVHTPPRLSSKPGRCGPLQYVGSTRRTFPKV